MPSDLPYHSPSSRSHVISLQHIATLMWKTGSTPNRALISVPVNPFIKVFPVDPEGKFLLPSPMLLSDPLMQYFVTTKMNMNSLCPDRKQDPCCNKRSIFDISLISYKNYLNFALTIFVILYILLLVCHMYVFMWRVCRCVWMSIEAEVDKWVSSSIVHHHNFETRTHSLNLELTVLARLASKFKVSSIILVLQFQVWATMSGFLCWRWG